MPIKNHVQAVKNAKSILLTKKWGKKPYFLLIRRKESC
mgnify:CR=1 FL=1|jgi:hypothetical protein